MTSPRAVIASMLRLAAEHPQLLHGVCNDAWAALYAVGGEGDVRQKLLEAAERVDGVRIDAGLIFDTTDGKP